MEKYYLDIQEHYFQQSFWSNAMKNLPKEYCNEFFF